MAYNNPKGNWLGYMIPYAPHREKNPLCSCPNWRYCSWARRLRLSASGESASKMLGLEYHPWKGDPAGFLPVALNPATNYTTSRQLIVDVASPKTGSSALPRLRLPSTYKRTPLGLDYQQPPSPPSRPLFLTR